MINRNSVLPTFQGNYSDMIGAIKSGDIKSPCFMWLEDKEVLAFIHWETNEVGNKHLVPHMILWDKITNIESEIKNLNASLGDLNNSLPEGSTVSTVINDIQKNGATVMLTTINNGGDA